MKIPNSIKLNYEVLKQYILEGYLPEIESSALTNQTALELNATEKALLIQTIQHQFGIGDASKNTLHNRANHIDHTGSPKAFEHFSGFYTAKYLNNQQHNERQKRAAIVIEMLSVTITNEHDFSRRMAR